MKKSYSTLLISLLLLTTIIAPIIPVSAYQGPGHFDYQSKLIQLTPSDSYEKQIPFIMKFTHFPSLSIGIIKDDQLIQTTGYGYYDLTLEKVPDEHTIYCLASVTKTVVGTALMQLYDQGLFDLDDDVNTVLPFDLRNPYFPDDPITFRMLLSHTSSLNMNTRNEYYWMNFTGDPPFSFYPDPYLKEFLLPDGKYYHEQVWSDTTRPGEKAMYANVGFDLISYLVELLSGESFLDYCQIHIFDPLEMKNTSFNLSSLPLDQVAIPYQHFLGKFYQINNLPRIFGPSYDDKYWRLRIYPAGGLYSSVHDLSHFLIAHMNQGTFKNISILQPETVELMHTIDPDNNIGYGLAWMTYPVTQTITTTGHGGDIAGVDTWMLYDESTDTGIIYLANGNPYYGFTPTIGNIAVQYLLYLLFSNN